MEEILTSALSKFGADERGTYIEGHFQELTAEAIVFEITGRRHDNVLSRLCSHIGQDLWNIATIADRLEWSRRRSLEDTEFSERWRNYTTVDIEHFHVEVRSIMDYSTQLIAEFNAATGQIPESYRKLVERLDKYRNRLSENTVSVVENTQWFWEIRTVRDSILHMGGRSIVFGAPIDGILFQVHDKNTRNLIKHRPFMHNNNVAYFEKYLSYYFCRVINYLDEIAEIGYAQLGIESRKPRARSYAGGFHVIKKWIEVLRDEVSSNK